MWDTVFALFSSPTIPSFFFSSAVVGFLIAGVLALGFYVYRRNKNSDDAYTNDSESSNNNDTSGYWRAPVIHATATDNDERDVTSSHPLNGSGVDGGVMDGKRVVTALSICHDQDDFDDDNTV